MISYIHNRRWTRLAVICIFFAGVYLLSNVNLGRIDTSNEWNKVGVVLRVQKRYTDAERAFFEARKENPSNPNTYLNLSVLYDATGEPEKARRMRAVAQRFMKKDYEKRFVKDLKGG